MTTLRLSQPESSGALIADLQTRADPGVESINSRALEAVGPTAARSTMLEYQVIYVTKSMGGLPNDGVEGDLNKAAREGWRLAGCITNEEARTTGLIMERQTPT